MSNVWFTSDLHVGHKLVAASRIQLPDGSPAYTDLRNLPEWFDDDVKRVDRIMAKLWDEAVKPDDHVWMLGDLCSGTDKAFTYALEWLASRPGHIHWIAGNHCPPHPMHRDAGKYQKRALEVVEEIHPYIRRRIPLLDGGHRDVMLCHFPYVDRFTGIGNVGMYDEYRLRDELMPVVHGHTHSKRQVSHSDRGTLQLHVGVDAWGGHLVPLSWLSERVSMDAGVMLPLEA